MPRRKTPFVAGGYYHLFNRGNNRVHIFLEDLDCQQFMKRLQDYLLPVVDLLAYCLMPNHFHLLIRLPPHTPPHITRRNQEISELSHAMMRLSVSYTKWFNRHRGRSGVLFEGAFGAKLIRTDSQLLAAANYIHRNPVEAGLVQEPGNWPYSSFPSYQAQPRGGIVETSPVLELLPTGLDYEQYLADLRAPRADQWPPRSTAQARP